MSLNRYTYGWNNPVRFTDPSGNSPVEFLRGISMMYNLDRISQSWASSMILEANGLNPQKGKATFTAFHEIAQVNIAKQLYNPKNPYNHPILEYKLPNGQEADVVFGGKVWEVKPGTGGTSAEAQLEIYEQKGELERGQVLKPINGIPVFGKLKMQILFPEEGHAYYYLYLDHGKDGIEWLKTAQALKYVNDTYNNTLYDAGQITRDAAVAGAGGGILKNAWQGLKELIQGIPLLAP
jgi:hypothetical protein